MRCRVLWRDDQSSFSVRTGQATGLIEPQAKKKGRNDSRTEMDRTEACLGSENHRSLSRRGLRVVAGEPRPRGWTGEACFELVSYQNYQEAPKDVQLGVTFQRANFRVCACVCATASATQELPRARETRAPPAGAQPLQ